MCLVTAESLVSRRGPGDAGHAPGRARDHALDTACASAPVDDRDLLSALRDVATGKIKHAFSGACPEVWEAGGETSDDRADPQDGCDACDVLRRADAAVGANVPKDARAALPGMLRRAYALDERQAATVLRVAEALAAGVSLEAREMLGREVIRRMAHPVTSPHDLGERLFALGRASVTPPDADLARVIASWCALSSWERGYLVSNVEHIARRHWADVAATALSPEGCAPLDRVRVTLEFARGPGVRVKDAEVWESAEPRPLTADEWQRLRAAGVPVADGVGV